jgi:hypothetical protein
MGFDLTDGEISADAGEKEFYQRNRPIFSFTHRNNLSVPISGLTEGFQSSIEAAAEMLQQKIF